MKNLDVYTQVRTFESERLKCFLFYPIAVTAMIWPATSSCGQILQWDRQWGTAVEDQANSVATDSKGNVYVSGHTRGQLGEVAFGSNDVFVTKFDSTGNVEWTTQYGTPGADNATGVAADDSGGVYVTGSVWDVGQSFSDAFLSRYDTNGDLIWTRTLGANVDSNDYSEGVAADNMGNIFIGGGTNGSFVGNSLGASDAFFSKYDGDGNLLWTKQFGTSRDEAVLDLTTDRDGNVLLAGYTLGFLDSPNLGGHDSFVRKYDNDGSLLWSRQFGTNRRDRSFSIAADPLGNTYVAGETEGNMDGVNRGGFDAFLRKYDSDGALQWTRQWGTIDGETAWGVSADALGNIVVGGVTGGDLGEQKLGERDAFLTLFDTEGSLRWTKLIGTANDEGAPNGVFANGSGSVFLAGYTEGSLSRSSFGGRDAFVVKYSTQVPEPHAWILILGAAAMLLPYTLSR